MRRGPAVSVGTQPSRRQVLAALAGGALTPQLALAFGVEAAPLAYTLKPERIAEGVWMLAGVPEAITPRNGGAIANVTILDTKAGAVVIDTGPSKRYGEALAKLATELTGKPVVRAYVTHFHPDHALGNQAFGAQALATTQGVADGLTAMGDDFAAAMYRTAGDWMRGTEVVLPGTIVGGGVEDFGDRRLRLLPLAGHTGSDLAILDERSGLLIAGDLVFLDRAPTTPNADLDVWRASLASLGGLAFTHLVPGHGPVEAGKRGLAQTADWLALVEGLVSDAFVRGLDMLEARELPFPPWAERIALARYELERTVMHLYPRLEAKGLPRVDAGRKQG